MLLGQGVVLLLEGGLLDLMLDNLALEAASSISCWIILRWITSSSVGMESISVRIMAQASSTRSMALSGRKRSVI